MLVERTPPERGQPDVRARAPRSTFFQRRLACVALAVAIFGVVGVSRATMAVLPLNADQGLYVTIGEVIKRGGVVGRDTWDNKPPGTYYLYAALLTFAPDYSATCTLRGGPLPPGGHDLPCAQIVLSVFDSLYAIAVAGAVWLVGRELFGELAGALAALLCAIFSSMIAVAHGGGIPDVYVLLPSTLAYLAAWRYADSRRRRWLVVAGAFGAAAILFKQTGFLAVAGIGVWLLVRGVRVPGRRGVVRATRDVGLLGLGTLVVLGPAMAIFALLGVLPDILEQAILFNRAYVTSPANSNSLLTQARLQTGMVFLDSQSGLWLAGLGGLVMLPGALRRDRRLELLAAWVAASVASVILGGGHFLVYYYLFLIPALSVCGGWALAVAWQATRLAWRAWLIGACATLLAYAGQFQLHEFGNAWYSRIQSTTHTPEEFVAGSIKDPHGSLFVWGNGSQVYALSGRPPASRFLHTLALSHDFAVHDQVAVNRAELMGTLNKAPPAVIVIDTPWLTRSKTLDFPELRALLARDYELGNEPSNPIFAGWQIYRRKA
ncbi:MAG: glycosyltransferase family 39 protein [Chloroflexota bacterium]|nr:glycosyltransferase family 39 protein [Chloroflexota bacterium]